MKDEQEQAPSALTTGTNPSGVSPYPATIRGQTRAVLGFCEGQLVLADGTCFNVELCEKQKHLVAPISKDELFKRRLILVSEIQKTEQGDLVIQFPLGTGDEGGSAAPDIERQRKADVEFTLLCNGGANGVAALAWFSGMRSKEPTSAGTLDDPKEITIYTWPPILLSRFEAGSPSPRSLEFLRQAMGIPVNCAALEQVLKAGLGEMKILAQTPAKEIEALTAKVQAVATGQTQHSGQLAQVLADTATLKDMGGQQAAARDEWHKNPLGCPEAITEFMVAMDAIGITGARAMALVWYGYGKTAKECAKDAGVSEATIKRDLAKACQTQYKPFFTGTPTQRHRARETLKKPEESFTLARRLSEKDREALIEYAKHVINTGPRPAGDGESDDATPWARALGLGGTD